MSPKLDRLLATLEPASAENLALRLQFGLACAERVRHLLEDLEVVACLKAFLLVVQSRDFEADLSALAARAEGLANRHQGSRSLDGVGHAAVSASHTCAKAIAGKARQAAEYGAYAAVYGQGGYGATSDASAFEAEDNWQATQLELLLSEPHVARSAA